MSFATVQRIVTKSPVWRTFAEVETLIDSLDVLGYKGQLVSGLDERSSSALACRLIEKIDDTEEPDWRESFTFEGGKTGVVTKLLLGEVTLDGVDKEEDEPTEESTRSEDDSNKEKDDKEGQSKEDSEEGDEDKGLAEEGSPAGDSSDHRWSSFELVVVDAKSGETMTLGVQKTDWEDILVS